MLEGRKHPAPATARRCSRMLSVCCDERGAGPPHGSFDRSLAAARHRGHLDKAESVDIDQGEQSAVERRKPAENITYQYGVVPRLDQRRQLRVVDSRDISAGLARVVDEYRTGDAEQPSGGRVPAPPGDGTGCLDKGLLGEVLGQLTVANLSQEVP